MSVDILLFNPWLEKKDHLTIGTFPFIKILDQCVVQIPNVHQKVLQKTPGNYLIVDIKASVPTEKNGDLNGDLNTWGQSYKTLHLRGV